MPNTPETTTVDPVTNDVQAAAAAAVAADYTKVTGSVLSFDELAGTIEGERRADLMGKMKPVIAGIRQSIRDNSIAAEKLAKEIVERNAKVDYMAKQEAELKEAVDNGVVASITDFNNFLAAEGRSKLRATLVNQGVKV